MIRVINSHCVEVSLEVDQRPMHQLFRYFGSHANDTTIERGLPQSNLTRAEIKTDDARYIPARCMCI